MHRRKITEQITKEQALENFKPFIKKYSSTNKNFSVEECIEDIKEKNVKEAFNAFYINVNEIKNDNLGSASVIFRDFITEIKSNKDEKFKNLRLAIKNIIEIFDNAIATSKNRRENIRVAYSLLYYYSSKQYNLEKYLKGDSDISKDSERVKKLKDRLIKCMNHLKIAYESFNETTDEKEVKRAKGIDSMIKCIDEVIKSLGNGFTENTIATLRKLHQVVLKEGSIEAGHGVKGMCEFVIALVRRSSISSPEAQSILKSVKSKEGEYNGLSQPLPRGGTFCEGVVSTPIVRVFECALLDLYKAHRYIKNMLLETENTFIKLFGENSDIVESLKELYNGLEENTNTGTMNSVREKKDKEIIEHMKNNIENVLALYENFIEKLKADNGGLAKTLLESFEIISEKLENSWKHLLEKYNKLKQKSRDNV